jgi:hypothetical protein
MNDKEFTAHCKDFASDMEFVRIVKERNRLRDALENLLGFNRKSTEHTVQLMIALSPAQKLRQQASRTEAHDAAIDYAREALATSEGGFK